MKHIFFFFLLIPGFLLAQKTTILKGTIKNKYNQPISEVSIKFNKTGTVSDENGRYSIRIPLDTEVTVIFSHVSYKSITKKFTAKNRNQIRFSPTLILKTEQLEEVIINRKSRNLRLFLCLLLLS